MRPFHMNAPSDNGKQESEHHPDLYRALFQQAGDPIVLVDPETGSFIDFNEQAHVILGYSRDEFQALTLSDLEVRQSPEAIHCRGISLSEA